jgi:hypothetical protein
MSLPFVVGAQTHGSERQNGEPMAQGASLAPVADREGSHDFDFESGAWTTHLRRLQNPLSNTSHWVEYNGSTVVRPLLDGRANVVELRVEGPAGRIEGVSLRLYDPEAHQWSLNFANIADGQLTRASTGAFANGRGEFYAQDTLRGRAILVRFVIFDITANSWSFEQAFSADGGKTWEVNWVATDTRVASEARRSDRERTPTSSR